MVESNVVSFEEVIVQRHTKNFILEYKSKGKAAAGRLIKEFPVMYKDLIAKRINEELKV